VAGWSDPFERDEEAYRFIAAAGDTAARHAPRPVGRTSLDGLEMSVETAAVGPRLIAYLHSSAPRRSKEGAVDRIASWLVELGRDTAAPGPALEPELERLERGVVPRWPVPGDLVRELGPVPAVLQHNDLGTWNVVVGGDDFTVLDWEDARRHGLPLWDLWYLLMDATAHLDGAGTLHEREEHFVRLFRGELPASARLFHWTRTAVREQGVPEESVGRLATLCWMQHGLSSEARSASVKVFDPGTEPVFWLGLLERLARRWLEHPELGPHWDRWRDA
jgi:Ser/Thr protein kinase RdoA (MazF antagonist)